MLKGRRKLVRGGQMRERIKEIQYAEGVDESSIRRANDREAKKQKRDTEGEMEANERKANERK